MNKELKKLFKELTAQGFRIEERKNGYMVLPADKTQGQVTIHKTPSDRRAWKNMISELRRCGYQTGK